MTKVKALLIQSSDISIRTKSGIILDTSSDVWAYRDDSITVRIDFERLSQYISPELMLTLKAFMRWQLEFYRPETVSNSFQVLSSFLKHAYAEGEMIEMITSTMYLNFASASNISVQVKLPLRYTLQRWIKSGHSGVASDVMSYIKKVVLKAPSRGNNVRTMDPIKGPFTDIELDAIQSELNNQFEAAMLTDERYILCSLFIMLGMRPIQYAALKVKDVFTTVSNGITLYFIQMPRAKQGSNLRDQFSTRAIIPKVGEVLVRYKQHIIFENKELTNPEELPLFHIDESQECMAIEGVFKGHCTSSGIRTRLVNTLSKLNVYSERTGEQIHINPRRFRQTIGTRAAAEGHGNLIIAELLDHSTTHNVGVYVQSTPAILKRIDKAIALQMAPLAQAFNGLLVNEQENDNAVLTPNYTDSFKPVGHCGSFEFCKTGQAVACYTCQNFLPWLDAEHEKVLDRLLADRERLNSLTDTRIASINDRLILAVAEVVRQCNEYKKEATDV